MIRASCDKGNCTFESEGVGLLMVGEAIACVNTIFNGLSDRNEKLGRMFKYAMIDAMESKELFKKDKEKWQRVETEDKPLTAEEAEKRMNEMREEMKEITRKLLEE